VVLTVYNNRNDLFVLKRDVIAPVRLDGDNNVYVIYKSVGYRLYRGRLNALSVFQEEPSVIVSSLVVPRTSISLKQVESLLGPVLESEGLFDQPVLLNFQGNQFGVYGFFSGPESLLLLLLDYVENRCSARLLAWEVGNFNYDDAVYTARLKFSSFANMDALDGQLTQFLNNLSMRDVVSLLKEQISTSVVQQSNARTPFAETRHQNIETESKLSDEIPDYEMNLVTQVDLHEYEPSTFSKKKVSADQKCLREVLMHGFPGLAIHPDSVPIIVSRFSNRKAIVNLLARLSSERDVRLKKIQGKAGQLGWREVDEHVATGVDKRGRVYVRICDAKDHSIDIYVDWKKDDKSQEKTLNMLTSLTSFSDRAVILG